MKSGPIMVFAAATLGGAVPSHADLWFDEGGSVVGVSTPDRTFVSPPHTNMNVALCRLSAEDKTFLALDLSFNDETGEIASMGFETRDPDAARRRPHPLQVATEPCGASTLMRFQFDWMIATARVIELEGEDVFSLAAPYRDAAILLTRDTRADALKGRWAIQEFWVKGHEHLPSDDPLNYSSDSDSVEPTESDIARGQWHDCWRDFDTILFDGGLAYQSLGQDITTELFVVPVGENTAILRYSRRTGSLSNHCETDGGKAPSSRFRSLDGVMLSLDSETGDLVGGVSGKRMTRDGARPPYETSDAISLRLRRRAARPAD